MESHEEHDYAMSHNETKSEEHIFNNQSTSKNSTYFLIPEMQYNQLQSGNRLIIHLSDGDFEIKEVILQNQMSEPDHDVNQTDISSISLVPDNLLQTQTLQDVRAQKPIVIDNEPLVKDGHYERNTSLSESKAVPALGEFETSNEYTCMQSANNIHEAEFAQQVQHVIASMPNKENNKELRKRNKKQEIRLVLCCVDCGKNFKTMKDMLEHVMQEHPESKPFQCEICHERFLNLPEWTDHVKTHLGKQSNKLAKENFPKRMCESCGQSFSSVEKLREHKIKDHRDEHPRVCMICGMGFKKPSSLRVHIDRHNGNAKIQCEVCGKRFYRNADLTRHLRDAHEPDATRPCFHCSEVVKVTEFYSHLRTHGPTPYTCQSCPESFSRKVELKFHIKCAHPDYKRHTCSICSVGFNEKYQLDRHMTEHTGIYKYPCTVCPKGFTRKDQLDVHMVSHTGFPLFECNICGRKFKRRDCFRSHKLIHSDQKPFHCELCNASFVTKDRLKKHLDKYIDMEAFECGICALKFHAEEHYEIHKVQEHYIEKVDEENPLLICSLCSKEYITKEFLINHLKSHFSKKNTHSKKYPRSKKSTEFIHSCEICLKQFKCKSYLTDHLATHSGERRYECLVCGKKFAKSKYLSEHKKTHKGNHVFECEICSKRYLDKKAYERHVNQHTLNFSDESSAEGESETEGDSGGDN